MVPQKIDDLLRDVSTQMAKSQLSRRSSGQSSRTSTGFRRNASRVMKTNSAGNSPRGIGRRTTVTSQVPARHRSTLDDHYDNMVSSVAPRGNQSRPHQVNRPNSWHPSSLAHGNRYGPLRCSDKEAVQPQILHSNQAQLTANYRHTMPSINTNLIPVHVADPVPSMGTSYPTQRMPESTGYQDYPCTRGQDLYPYGPLTFSDPVPGPDLEVRRGLAIPQYLSTASSYDTWSRPQRAQVTDASAPSTPDFLPIQYPPPALGNFEHNRPLRLPKQPSKELVGMGLYDDPDTSPTVAPTNHPQHFFRSQTNLYPRYQPAGKGLKLEETWQPPEEGLDQLDESYSSDGSEDEPSQTNYFPASQQLQVPAPPPDLSNHSFYFENEDPYDGKVFLDETMSAIEAKVPGSGFDAFAWA